MPETALTPIRALPTFYGIPELCILHHEDRDLNWPHVRPGEMVVVDTGDRDLIRGELFLFEWSNGARSIHQLQRREFNVCQPDGPSVPTWCWIYAHMNPKAGIAMCNGPVTDEKEGYLQSLIVGRVIGLYQALPVPQLREGRS